MNKIISMIGALGCAICIGCKTTPSVDSVYATANMVGVSTGMVCNQLKIDDESRNVVIDIINKVDTCIPQTNETFQTAWTPIAEQHTAKLVADGKITDAQAKLILQAFKTVTMGIDYVCDVKYPKIREYQNLTEAAVHGFTTGFLAIFRPANVFSSPTQLTFDKEAYLYLSFSNK